MKLPGAKIGIYSVLLIACTSEAVFAQNMSDLLDRKYKILQQLADAETTRAEAEAERVRAQAQPSDRSSVTRAQAAQQTSYAIPSGDVVADSGVPSCKLAGGGSIKVSGGLRRSVGVKCSQGK